MIVTDKQYYIDDNYISKLDLMIKRMEGTDDNLLIIDGDEGTGKSELATGTCYYIAYKTERKYNIDNIFFDLDEAMKFAGETKEQIIHIDEGVLGLLSTHWWKKNQQKFIQFVMIARKKKHFIVICIPKFYKLNQYIIEERAIGLVHVYARKNLQKGRFLYYLKNAKESLYEDWSKKRIKNYKKYYSFHGSFVKAMDKIFTKEQVQQYEDKKDKAIMDLTKEQDNKKISRKEQEWSEQRNILIKYLKEKEGLSQRKTEERLEELGITLSHSMICNVLNKERIPLSING